MVGPFVKGKTAVFIDAANIFYSQKTLKWRIDYGKLLERAKYIPLPKLRGFIEKFKEPDKPAPEV